VKTQFQRFSLPRTRVALSAGTKQARRTTADRTATIARRFFGSYALIWNSEDPQMDPIATRSRTGFKKMQWLASAPGRRLQSDETRTVPWRNYLSSRLAIRFKSQRDQESASRVGICSDRNRISPCSSREELAIAHRRLLYKEI